MGRNCEIKENRMAKKFNYEDITLINTLKVIYNSKFYNT